MAVAGDSFRPTDPATIPASEDGTDRLVSASRTCWPATTRYASVVSKARSTPAPVPATSTASRSADTDGTRRPSDRSQDRTWATWAVVGLKRASHCCGVRNRPYEGEPGVDTAVASAAAPAGSRVLSTSSKLTAAPPPSGSSPSPWRRSGDAVPAMGVTPAGRAEAAGAAVTTSPPTASRPMAATDVDQRLLNGPITLGPRGGRTHRQIW